MQEAGVINISEEAIKEKGPSRCALIYG